MTKTEKKLSVLKKGKAKMAPGGKSIGGKNGVSRLYQE